LAFVRQHRRVPCADDVPPRIGICPQLLDELRDLVNAPSAGRFPRAPLRSIDRAEIAFFVCPRVPNVNLVFCEILDVGVARQKPQQLVNDSLEENFPRGD
jgi:hypothetical protein